MERRLMGPESNAPASNAARLKRGHFASLGPFLPPATEAERRLMEIWEAVLNISGLGVEDDFFELGGESIAAVTLFSELERVLGQMPPLSTLLDYSTIRSLAGRIEQLGATSRDCLLLPIRAQGLRMPLFQAHAAHGNVLFARRLLPFLDAEQPLYAIQARGLQEGETPHRSFEAIAADYVAQIRRIQPSGPYMLAGHCVGGLIVYEMAQRLKALGQDVGAVVMIDPEYHPNAVPWLHWRNPSALHIRLWRELTRPVWFARRWLRRIRDRVAGRLVVEQPTETGANRQRQQAIMIGLRAALLAYRPRPYEGRLAILCSAERRKHLSNPATGWPALAPRVQFIELGGSHDEVFFAALPAVGGALERILQGAQPASLRPLDRSAAE
jgi:thioesterase domain-containing protein/acyl carrier protein